MSSFGANVSLGDVVSLQVPIWIDLGGRISDEVMIGAYGQYGFLTQPNCGAGLDCSGSDFRIGAQVHYHPQPHASVDPWLGIGAGYEVMALSASNGVQSVSIGARGFELVNLQGGIDWGAGSSFSVGPFVGLAVGQFDSADVTTIDGKKASGDITQKALHQWLTLGLRGVFH